jgi:hypothetical protein
MSHTASTARLRGQAIHVTGHVCRQVQLCFHEGSLAVLAEEDHSLRPRIKGWLHARSG